MTRTKDLSWLSAPAFFLIIGLIFFSVKKQASPVHIEKARISQIQKQA